MSETDITKLLLEQINRTVEASMKLVQQEACNKIDLAVLGMTQKFDDRLEHLCDNCRVTKDFYGNPDTGQKGLKRQLENHLCFHKRINKFLKFIAGLVTASLGALSFEDIRKLFHR
jgi:hypothetical protein